MMDLTNLNKERKNKRKPAIDLSSMVYGKVPPQAKDLEEAVLGGLMLDRAAFDIIAEILKPQCFYVDAHQRIYKAIQYLSQRSQPVDILTVVEQLKVNEELEIVGGPYYVTKLTNAVVSIANIEAHARIVLQKFIQRELIRISGEIIADAYEDSVDVFELIDESDKKFTDVTTGHLQKSFTHIMDGIAKSINRLDELRNNPKHIVGVPSGLHGIDHITHGWRNTDLIILAARPSVGKTALALNFARNAALNNVKPVSVGFFSLEMSTSQLIDRILSSESEVFLDKFSTGQMSDMDMEQLLVKGVVSFEKTNIFIDDTAGLTLYQVKSRARVLKRKHNVGLIIIDYMQLMTGDAKSGNREQEISTISRGLKSMAKELDVPVIALSQLSRAPEQRKGESKMPQLSDLRESGAIEQDADMVMFLYRPEYYDSISNEMGESTRGETHVRIAKHRNGVLDTVKLRANLAIQKFNDWDGMQALKENILQKDKGWIPVGSRLKTDVDEDNPF